MLGTIWSMYPSVFSLITTKMILLVGTFLIIVLRYGVGNVTRLSKWRKLILELPDLTGIWVILSMVIQLSLFCFKNIFFEVGQTLLYTGLKKVGGADPDPGDQDGFGEMG